MTDLSSLSLTFGSVRKAISLGVPAEALIAESSGRAKAAADAGIFTSLVPERGRDQRVGRAAKTSCRRRDAAAARPGLRRQGQHPRCRNGDDEQLPGACNHAGGNGAILSGLLEEAGAVLIGKNTMDQFATGLNGTRSPEPLCRNAINPSYIPGGSSSGSAVAVARDIVSFSLGSDTGGSGRVPAACNGIVGLKPTYRPLGFARPALQQPYPRLRTDLHALIAPTLTIS